jgi:hypothetical protein
MDKCRQLHDTATLTFGKQKVVVILLTMSPTHCTETSLTNQMTLCYNQNGKDVIPNHFSVNFTLFNPYSANVENKVSS